MQIFDLFFVCFFNQAVPFILHGGNLLDTREFITRSVEF